MAQDVRDRLETVISELAEAGDIEGSAIVRRDGLMIASNLPSKIDARTIAAMAAALVGTAETCSNELQKGKFQQVIIESQLGKIASLGAGNQAILITLLKPQANLGLILLAMDKATKKIEILLEK